MRIECKCDICGKELLTHVTCNIVDDIIIDVSPCNDIDCYDCSKCEIEKESKKLNNENEELTDEVAELKVRIKKLKKKIKKLKL